MKKIISELSNVLFDESSSYDFEELNETNFLTELLTSLSKKMQEEFDTSNPVVTGNSHLNLFKSLKNK
tara:strand:+ start:10226 stop:10429 length:204 start_codon:yes stop_codon:yes gene_type:complete